MSSDAAYADIERCQSSMESDRAPTVTSPMAPQPINYQQLFGRGV